MWTCPKNTSAGQRERGCHLDVLGPEQQVAPVVAVGDDSADQREQQDRQLAEKVVEAKEERGFGEVENEPALRHLLHPRPDRRGEGAEPQNTKIAVCEGGQRALQERVAEGDRGAAAGRAARVRPSICSGVAKRHLS